MGSTPAAQSGALAGVSVLLVTADIGARERLARALRAAGADVAERRHGPAPAVDVLLVDSGTEARMRKELDLITSDVRMRWSSMVRFEFLSAVPVGAAPDLGGVEAAVAPALTADRALAEQLRASSPVEVQLEPLGPIRILRVAAGTGQTLHLSFQSSDTRVDCDVADGLLVCAFSRGGSGEREGGFALAPLLDMDTAQVTVTARERPSAVNIMEPVDQALELAAVERQSLMQPLPANDIGPSAPKAPWLDRPARNSELSRTNPSLEAEQAQQARLDQEDADFDDDSEERPTMAPRPSVQQPEADMPEGLRVSSPRLAVGNKSAKFPQTMMGTQGPGPELLGMRPEATTQEITEEAILERVEDQRATVAAPPPSELGLDDGESPTAAPPPPEPPPPETPGPPPKASSAKAKTLWGMGAPPPKPPAPPPSSTRLPPIDPKAAAVAKPPPPSARRQPAVEPTKRSGPGLPPVEALLDPPGKPPASPGAPGAPAAKSKEAAAFAGTQLAMPAPPPPPADQATAPVADDDGLPPAIEPNDFDEERPTLAGKSSLPPVSLETSPDPLPLEPERDELSVASALKFAIEDIDAAQPDGPQAKPAAPPPLAAAERAPAAEAPPLPAVDDPSLEDTTLGFKRDSQVDGDDGDDGDEALLAQLGAKPKGSGNKRALGMVAVLAVVGAAGAVAWFGSDALRGDLTALSAAEPAEAEPAAAAAEPAEVSPAPTAKEPATAAEQQPAAAPEPAEAAEAEATELAAEAPEPEPEAAEAASPGPAEAEAEAAEAAEAAREEAEVVAEAEEDEEAERSEPSADDDGPVERDKRGSDEVCAAARRAERGGHPDEALQLYERGRELDPKNPRAYEGLARIHLERGNLTEALDAAERAVKLRRRRSRYRVLLGDVLRAAGRDSDARSAYKKALELDPDDEDAARRLN